MPSENMSSIKLTVVENAKCDDNCFIEVILYLNKLREKINYTDKISFTDLKTNYFLSTRELDVLTLLCKSMSNKQIAKEINISTHTVKVHIHNICEKLAVNNRTEAIIKSLQHNLVELKTKINTETQT